MAHMLIVDDEPSICWGLTALAEELGHSATAVASAEKGFDAATSRRPDAIVLDVRLPGISGVAAMEQFREIAGPVPIIIVTAFGDLATAVDAVRHGAFEYLLKPFDLAVVQRAIQRALQSMSRQSETDRLQLPSPADAMIVGHSSAIQEVFKQIAMVAPSDACVHLQGESGTGKELAARAIHRYSRRSEGPFVAVNVASLSESLAESELLGHARGAFTGADQAHKGLLEQANGGTILLDEVADIPLSLQVKLLRVLEHGELLPVGGDRPVKSDFRLLSATHQDLCQRVAKGDFRHDLYFRLVTFKIEIPPLRQHRGDIPELAAYFLSLLAAKDSSFRPVISAEVMAELQRRDWLGNVRELRNAIEHAMILARGGLIGLEHLPPPVAPGWVSDSVHEEAIASLVRQWAESELRKPGDGEDLYERFLNIVEPSLLRTVMEHCGGQCLAAARRLGLHRTTVRKKLDQFVIGDCHNPTGK
jgi:two-component system, NtrC family, nitrogen regulation response regulator GlnG